MANPLVGSWAVEIKVNSAADSMRWNISNSFESAGDGGVSVQVGSGNPLDVASLELRNLDHGVQVVTEFNTADCLQTGKFVMTSSQQVNSICAKGNSKGGGRGSDTPVIGGGP